MFFMTQKAAIKSQFLSVGKRRLPRFWQDEDDAASFWWRRSNKGTDGREINASNDIGIESNQQLSGLHGLLVHLVLAGVREHLLYTLPRAVVHDQVEAVPI